MVVFGVAIVEVHVPHSRSLKDKRRVIKGLIDRIQTKHRVSISETAHQDVHQRSQIALAIVGTRERETEDRLERFHRSIEETPDLVITRWDTDLIVDLD